MDRRQTKEGKFWQNGNNNPQVAGPERVVCFMFLLLSIWATQIGMDVAIKRPARQPKLASVSMTDDSAIQPFSLRSC